MNPTSRSGTGCIITITACLITGSCVTRIESPSVSVSPTEAPEYHRPTACRHLYNTGRSLEWQHCMGVGPRR